MRGFRRCAVLVASVAMAACRSNESAGEEGAAVEADVTERLVAMDSAVPPEQSPADDGRPMDYLTAVLEYRVDMPRARRVGQARLGLIDAERRTPAVAAWRYLEQEHHPDPRATQARIDSVAEARAAVEAAGSTTREVVLTVLALKAALWVDELREQGVDIEMSANESNVALVRRNEPEIRRILGLGPDDPVAAMEVPTEPS